MSKKNKKNQNVEAKAEKDEVLNEENVQEQDQEQVTEEDLDTADKKIAELEAALEHEKKEYLFLMADLENFRKRTLKEKADLILAGGEKTITAILPVLDDFERAIADKSDDPAAIKEGMKLIFQKFQKTLESLGVKKIETDGVDFNVDYHEAIAQVPGMGDDKAGKVIDCVQTGYTLNDKVIRFAKVAVGQA